MNSFCPEQWLCQPGRSGALSTPANFAAVHQNGLVLLLSLAILAGLSLLAVLAATSMLQQQHMAANHSDGELARLAAVAAVSAGEKFLFSLPNESRIEDCLADCFIEPAHSMMLSPGLAPEQPEYLPDDWWLQWGHPSDHDLVANPGSSATDPASALPSRVPPLFIIQELEFLAATQPQDETGLPAVSGVAYYQVLGRGTGLGSHNTHVAESILARPWFARSEDSSPVITDCRMYRPAFDCGRMAYRERR